MDDDGFCDVFALLSSNLLLVKKAPFVLFLFEDDSESEGGEGIKPN